MASAVFVPLHAGSWLISIFAAAGAVPSNLTVPLTVAAVAGSIGVAAGAAAGVAAGCSAVSSFLPQPARRTSPHSAGRSEEHTSELQSHHPISYAVFCLKKKK